MLTTTTRSSQTFRAATSLAGAAAALFLCLAFPATSSATSVSALGTSGGTTVCEIGSCPDPDADNIIFGQSSQGILNFTYKFTNGDTYNITGFYINSYGTTGSQLDFAPNVTYAGNNGNNVASVGTDVLSLTMFQNIFDSTPGSWDGQYCEAFPINLSNGVSATAAVSYYAVSVGTLAANGPYQSGANPQTQCRNLSLPSPQDTSNYLESAYTLTFTFNQGVTPGTNAVTPVPEPASALSLLLASSSVAAAFLFRRRRASL